MVFSFDGYELDEERFELRKDGVKVPVQPKVLDVLFHLVRGRERVVLKRELFLAVWPGVKVSEAALSRVILEVRRAIGDESQEVVVTVRGRGFRFVGAVVEQAKAPAAEAARDDDFVGRSACMTALEARLEDALRKKGSVVWLSGEAGIGKTRTADELGRRARARGANVYVARAHETPKAPPFWLWTQLARALAPDAESTIGARMSTAQSVSGDAEFKLFDEVTRFFVDASRTKPLVLVLDDVHWADEGSLALLQFFAREARDASVLVLATYRDTALTGDARARAIGGLLSAPGSLTIPLRGLSAEEIPRFVEIVRQGAPSAKFASALFERSGGNPLYLRELLKTEWADRALADSAAALLSTMDIPQGFIESISQHLEGVSPGARDILTVAALIGREFDLAKLALVCGDSATHAELLNRLDEAARARVVVKAKDGKVRFTHRLVQDVLSKSLSSAERAALHRQIAEKLRAHYGDSCDLHAAELAHHFARALPGGDPAPAIAFSIRAAEQDESHRSFQSAATHWQRAAQALLHVRGDDVRHVHVAIGLAEARAAAGDADAAREAFLDAAVLARTFGQPEALARAALGFVALPGIADVAERPAMLDEALAALADVAADSATKLAEDLRAAKAAIITK